MKDMRKRLFIVLALMVCGFAGAWAGEVTPEQAREIAQKFVKSHGSRRAAPEMEQPVKVSGLYIFNINNNGGYVIVSNDDQTTPILGFSDSGSIDPNNMPSNMRVWLQGYADEIAWLQKNGITTTPAADKARRRASAHSTNAIEPMISTKWGQDEPYNYYCPMVDEGYKIVTGCVATAMAQVMYYTERKAGNNTTTTTTEIPAYTWNNRSWGPIDQGSTLNWSAMQTTYTGEEDIDTDASAQAVATLMKYCGYSVRMNYGSNASSAYLIDVGSALKSYFGYKSTVTHYSRYKYTYSSWVDMIYNELSQGRPVLYAGQAVDGGHAFVCDGYKYDSTDLFHINWGWDGLCNGYFVLSVLNPDDQGTGGSASNSAYTCVQEAIVGIQKTNGTGTVEAPTAISNLNITINSITLSHSTIALGESVNAIINVTNNSDTNIFDGEICLFVNNNRTVGKMFEIASGATANCIITFTPTATGTYSLNAKYPNTSNGDYIPSGVSDVTLTVVDQTPTNLTASEITQTSAKISWTNVGGATKWNMRSRSVTATIEDFNDFSTFNNNSFKEKDWKRITFNGGNSQLRLSDNGGIGNSKCMISPSYENNADVNPNGGGLRTPKFNLGGFVSFYAWGVGEHFQVYISTNGSNYHAISDEISAANTPTQYSFDLAEYANQEGYIAIIHCNSSGHTSNSYLYIDNVSFTEPVGEWSTTPDITTNSNLLTGLSAETYYEVQVQAVNNDGGKWSNPLLFTTLAYPVPTDLTVSDVTPTSAKVSWTGSASSYDVRYAVRSEDYGNEATWLQYDNDTYSTNTGFGSDVVTTWGVMYPSNLITCSKLTQIAFYIGSYNTNNITVNIYSGGNTAPEGTPLYSGTLTPPSTTDLILLNVPFDKPVNITPGKNLWITLTEKGTYPIISCTKTNVPNNTWMYNNGWVQQTDRGWMIRAYIEPDNVNWSEPVNYTDQPPYKLTGLDHTKNYAVQVRGNNGSSGNSDWATVTFDKASGNLVLGNNNTNNAELIADWDGFPATSVTLTGRTLYKDGKWNTICLPFSLNATQLGNSPLADADIRELSKTASGGKVTGFDEATNSLILNFETVNNAIEAGKPYIVKWSSGDDISNPVFTNVTIDKQDASVTSNDGAVTFTGSYNKQVFNEVNTSILLFGTKEENNKVKNILYYPKATASLGACRAYFQLADGYTVPNEGSSTIRSFVMNFGDDDSATGIIAIGDSQLSTLNSPLSGWYTLDGRKLNGKPTAKGVYVKNGKKIVIK